MDNKKHPMRKDVLLIALVIVAAVVLLIVSRVMPRTRIDDIAPDLTLAPDAVTYLDDTQMPTWTPAPEKTVSPEPSPEASPTPEVSGAPQPAAAGPMPMAQTDEVRGYVVIQVNGQQYGNPIAMDRDKIITIRQDADTINQVHITPQSVYMESSTCANQDCVGQGIVTLDNYETRILGAYVICLPNGVTLELVPAEESGSGQAEGE